MIDDGYVLVVKRDCPTCRLIEPVCTELLGAGVALSVLSQDDPAFPPGCPRVIDDTALAHSYSLGIEIVPTLIQLRDGAESGRVVGWQRGEWEALTSVDGLGEGLPDERPGCGSLSAAPGAAEALQLRFGEVPMRARGIDVHPPEDPVEICFDRGWSDGLPVVPPTPVRVLRMLQGTTRDAAEVIGRVPPGLAECSVEKAAINAVMAGCAPAYFPVVLAAVEAALVDDFCLHGILATTAYVGPVLVVNGPIARRIGMNCGVNALGQGNRANATIGRALQLVVRNVGTGVPGGVDRATLGQPGKYTFCFAEDEADARWQPLCAERGFAPGASTVTVFAGGGVHGVWDEAARSPQALIETFIPAVRARGVPGYDTGVLLVISPEHWAIFREAGWGRSDILGALHEGAAAQAKAASFRDDGLLLVRAGGPAGLSSAVVHGWGYIGALGSNPVTREVGT